MSTTVKVLYVGWYRQSGRGKWLQTPPMETQEDARQLARQAAQWLRVKSWDTCVCVEGIDPNERKK